MSKGILSNLEPKDVWSLFEEMTQVPRPSKKEGKIGKWIKKWAKENSIECKEDDVGNLLLSKGPSKNCDTFPTLIIQGHMDMVCQKEADYDIDFENDPLEVETDGIIVSAKGTSLGADNGIGLAIAMSLLKSEEIQHGPLEVLITVDEETGLTGAFNIKKGFFTGKYLLNIDSEVLGEITIGSAGGGDVELKIPVKSEIKEKSKAFRIKINGLKGGHSGIDINKTRLNAIKIGVDALNTLRSDLDTITEQFIFINSIKGGSVHNAIPREFECVLLVPEEYYKDVKRHLKNWLRYVKFQMKEMEPNAKIILTEVKENKAFSASNSEAIISAIVDIYHGTISQSQEIEGLVQTSNNLAKVRTSEKNVEISVSTRSSVDEELQKARDEIKIIGEGLGGSVELSKAYPGWDPNLDSSFLKLVKEKYEEVYGKEIKLRAIHAGLECGLFMGLDSELQISSIGPTIKNVHSPDESVDIESVKTIWEIVKLIVNNMKDLT